MAKTRSTSSTLDTSQRVDGVTDSVKTDDLVKFKEEISAVKGRIDAVLKLDRDVVSETVRLRREWKNDRNELRHKIDHFFKCPLCSRLMFNPYTLHPCGDSVCSSCLLVAFKEEKSLFTHCAFYPKEVMRRIVDDLDGEQNMLNGHQQLTTVFHPSRFVRPYKCPVCESPVHIRPILNFSLKSVVTAIHGDFPAPNPDIWDPYFVRPFAYDGN